MRAQKAQSTVRDLPPISENDATRSVTVSKQPLHARAVILTYNPAYYRRTLRTYKYTEHTEDTE